MIFAVLPQIDLSGNPILLGLANPHLIDDVFDLGPDLGGDRVRQVLISERRFRLLSQRCSDFYGSLIFAPVERLDARNPFRLPAVDLVVADERRAVFAVTDLLKLLLQVDKRPVVFVQARGVRPVMRIFIGLGDWLLAQGSRSIVHCQANCEPERRQPAQQPTARSTILGLEEHAEPLFRLLKNASRLMR
ncbi:MAG: hypothetical protein DWQ31_04570 [Planctomycetota bacterium]|nr:MAG: hypothetical protein DWQ31_04570 [Planctomycetota bacterium]